MKYIRYALFMNAGEADAAVRDLQESGVSEEQLNLVLHEDKIATDDMKAFESDGNRGLLIGLLSGGAAGVLSGLVLTALHVLPLSLLHGGLFGLVLGLILGSIGGGLFGSGLPALSLRELEKLWKKGNVLAAAQTDDWFAAIQVEHIFKKHHALVAMG
jgi:hypothetical protein